MDMSQYRELFLSETREHLNSLNKLAVALEQEPGNRETINALFREAHSIKGMAATMGYDRTARLAHHLEDLLDGLRSSGEVTAGVFDHLLAGIDLLDGLLDDLTGNRPERDVEPFLEGSTAAAPNEAALPEDALVAIADDAAKEAVAPPAQAVAHDPDTGEAFQVLIELAPDTPASAARCMVILRELEKSGGLISTQPDLATLRGGAPCFRVQGWLRATLPRGPLKEALQRISGVIAVRFAEDRRQRERRAGDEETRTVRVRTDLLDQFINLTGELITRRHALSSAAGRRDWGDLNLALAQTGRLLDDLHHHVLQARLMPVEQMTGRLPRIVRDLSRKSGKQVELRLEGGDVGIDRAVHEELTDPLVHLVRNAVDHGIASRGTVTVAARRDKELVLIEVADDGRGMDPDRLRRKAVEKGLLDAAQAAALSDRDALMLVCRPGFSTAETVTETSGRGVGMDVVKAAVDTLGGTLEIDSAPGRGTRFLMRLPLSVAIIKLLLVECADRLLAIPFTRVERTVDLPADEILEGRGGHSFLLDDEELPLVPLAAPLGLPEPPPGAIAWVVVARVQGRRVGLRVDRLRGHREAFVKSLGFPLDLLTGLAGACLEGDGRIVFIIDPQTLLDSLPGKA